MRRDGLNILITLDEWLDAGLSFDTYKVDKRRGYLQTAGRGCNGRAVEIIWGSIQKECRRAAIIGKYGKPEEIVRVNRLEAAIKADNRTYDFFHGYIVDDESGRRLKPEVADRYYANAIVLDAVHFLATDHRAFKMALGNISRPKIWPSLAEAVNELNRIKYPHDLPGCPKRLKDKVKIYKSEGPECLIHGNFLNRHAASVKGDTQEAILIELIGDGNNLDNAQLARLYNVVAEGKGWDTVSPSTVGNYRQKYYLETYPGRRGLVAHNNRMSMQVKRSRPTSPLFFWTLDGWDVELLYQERADSGGDGKKRGNTEYHNRPTVVVVLDPFSYYPIGFAVGRKETPELIKTAVRNAINHTAELFGRRYRAWQVQSDRYAISKMTQICKPAADKYTPARAKNAKAKTIEQWFNRLNRDYCQMLANWNGFGIQSKKDSQPNDDVMNARKCDYPDFNGVCGQVIKIISDVRAKLRDDYVASFGALSESDKLTITTEDFLYHFGAVRLDGDGAEIKNRMEGHGLVVTIDGEKHTYDCFDLTFRRHYGQVWTVKYDPSDLRQVLACNDDGSLRFMLEEKYIQPMALRDRKEGDAAELKRVRDFNRAEVAYITDFRAAKGEIACDFFADNPDLNDTLAKHLICDSKGQHKNVRNAKRLSPVVEMADGVDDKIDIFQMI